MIVLAGSARGIVRAELVGGAWEVGRVVSGVDVRAFAADAAVLYAGVELGGVWLSEDGGHTWRPGGLEGERVRSLAAGHGRVYAGTKPARVWTRQFGGNGWEPLASFSRWRSWFWWSPAEKPHTAYVQALAVSPTDRDVLLAGIEAGALVRSDDGGRTWSWHRRRASRDPHVVSFHPGGAWAYEGGGTGPARSADGGTSWEKVTRGLERRYCWGVAGDRADPSVWYVGVAGGPRRAHGAGHAGAAVLRADGDGWTVVADDLEAMPYHLEVLPSGELVAVLASGEVRISPDAGHSWEIAPLALGRLRTALVLASA